MPTSLASDLWCICVCVCFCARALFSTLKNFLEAVTIEDGVRLLDVQLEAGVSQMAAPILLEVKVKCVLAKCQDLARNATPTTAVRQMIKPDTRSTPKAIPSAFCMAASSHREAWLIIKES